MTTKARAAMLIAGFDILLKHSRAADLDRLKSGVNNYTATSGRVPFRRRQADHLCLFRRGAWARKSLESEDRGKEKELQGLMLPFKIGRVDRFYHSFSPRAGRLMMFREDG
jgi:hypothetical protein